LIVEIPSSGTASIKFLLFREKTENINGN
jgi:hypothetical protein